MSQIEKGKYNNCFICGKKETLYRKVYKTREGLVRNPNDFWICDRCYNIEIGKMIKLQDGVEFYFIK